MTLFRRPCVSIGARCCCIRGIAVPFACSRLHARLTTIELVPDGAPKERRLHVRFRGSRLQLQNWQNIQLPPTNDSIKLSFWRCKGQKPGTHSTLGIAHVLMLTSDQGLVPEYSQGEYVGFDVLW